MKNKKPMQAQLIKSLSGVSILTLLINIIAIALLLQQLISNNALAASQSAVASANFTLDMTIKNTENISNMIGFNNMIQDALVIVDRGNKGKLVKSTQREMLRIPTMFNSAMLYSNVINNIVIYDIHGNLFTSMYRFADSTIEEYPSYQLLENSLGQNIWTNAHLDPNDFNAPNRHVIKAIRKIEMMQAPLFETVGYMFINVKEEALFLQVSIHRSSPDSLFFITDKDFTILSSQDKSLLSSPLKVRTAIQESQKEEDSYFGWFDNQYQLISYKQNTKTEWYVFEIIPVTSIFWPFMYYFLGSLLMFATLLISNYFIAKKLSASFIQPIRQLETHISHVEQGVFDYEITPPSRFQEIDNLHQRFNVMTYRINQLIDEVYTAELQKSLLQISAQQAHIQALEQQISPHFLYNILDSIQWMLQIEQVEIASKMLHSLASLFRYTISQQHGFILIREELDALKHYIYLQKMRYGIGLQILYEVEEATLNFLTLKLLLQPLVENALVHGIEPLGGVGTITIQITEQNDRIFFSVSDNGAGISKKEIQKIEETLLSSETNENHIGLLNVHRRLTLQFDMESRLVLKSSLNEGTQITFSIPKQEQGKN